MKYFLLTTLVSVIIALTSCWQPGSNPTSVSKPPNTTTDPTQIPILVYHHIMADPDPDMVNGVDTNAPLYCDQTTFNQEMNYLKSSGYTSISFDDLVAFLKGNKSLPTKSVIICFDDGLASQVTPIISTEPTAIQTLQEYGFTATFYIIVEAISGVNTVSDLETLFPTLCTNATPYDEYGLIFPNGGLNENGQQMPSDSLDWPPSWNTDGWGDNYMAWSDVKKLDSEGMIIGCHTMTHPDLTNPPYFDYGTTGATNPIPDPPGDNLVFEVAGAKTYLESFLDHPVNSFNYPYGCYNASTGSSTVNVVPEVQSAGFTSARADYSGILQIANGASQLFTLPCYEPSSLSDMKAYIQTGATTSSAEEARSLLMKREFK